MEPRHDGPIATLADDLIASRADEIYTEYDSVLAASGNPGAIIDAQFVIQHARLAQFCRDMSPGLAQLLSSDDTPPETVAEVTDITYRSLIFAYQTCAKFSSDPHMHDVGDWHGFAGRLAELDDTEAANFLIRKVDSYLRGRPALEAFVAYYSGILANGASDLEALAEVFSGLAFMLVDERATVSKHLDGFDAELTELLGDA